MGWEWGRVFLQDTGHRAKSRVPNWTNGPRAPRRQDQASILKEEDVQAGADSGNSVTEIRQQGKGWESNHRDKAESKSKVSPELNAEIVSCFLNSH